MAAAAAVGYLYARILDTYEDLLPDKSSRPAALRTFAARFDEGLGGALPEITDAEVRDHRDRLHLLLVEKVGLIDAVFASLAASHRLAIRDMVHSMADGMAWAADRFAEQGGVLVDDDQLFRYCHSVIGYPALFTIELLSGAPPSSPRDAFAVSEMIQLANVTRDIETDLLRGVAYDPLLRPHLGGSSAGDVRDVRERLVSVALSRASAYRRLYESIDLDHRGGARLAAVLMLLFTDLHYRAMTVRIGRRPWRGPRGKILTLCASLPASVSARYAARVIRRVEARFLTAAQSLNRSR